ncbi:glycosyltransferase family 39 protein [Patescibacteria group bacterium]|nr:glycosyltransferase family 39 protein [Patescibacteria group bacterium]
MRQFYKNHKKEIFLFILAFSFELLIIFSLIRINGIEIFFRGDGRDYQNLANNIIQHQMLAITAQPPFLPTSFRPPIYPFWLAMVYLIFKSFVPAIFIGAAVFALSTPLAFLIGKQIFSEKNAMIGAIIFGLEPWALFQSGFIAAEQIFMPVFLLCIYFFCLYLKHGRTPCLYWASFLLAITALIRPISLFFILILIFFVFIFEFKGSFLRPFKISVLTFLIFIMVLSPWFVRNKLILNSWQFSSASGISIFNDYFMLGRYLGEIGPREDLYERAKQVTGADNDINAITTVENSKKLHDFAVKNIILHPYSFLKMQIIKGLPMFLVKNSYGNILFDLGLSSNGLKPSEIFNKNLTNLWPFIKNLPLSSNILIFISLFWPIIISLSIFGIYEQIKINRRNLPIWFLIFWILYFTFLTALGRDISRYKLTINAPLFMLAVAGFYEIKKRFLTFSYKND